MFDVSWKTFCEQNLVHNTKQPGMLKTPVGFQNLFLMHSPMYKSTEQTRTQNPEGQPETRP